MKDIIDRRPIKNKFSRKYAWKISLPKEIKWKLFSYSDLYKYTKKQACKYQLYKQCCV